MTDEEFFSIEKTQCNNYSLHGTRVICVIKQEVFTHDFNRPLKTIKNSCESGSLNTSWETGTDCSILHTVFRISTVDGIRPFSETLNNATDFMRVCSLQQENHLFTCTLKLTFHNMENASLDVSWCVS